MLHLTKSPITPRQRLAHTPLTSCVLFRCIAPRRLNPQIGAGASFYARRMSADLKFILHPLSFLPVLWSTHRTCRFLGISRSTLRRWRKANPDKLGAVKPNGTDWRYNSTAIQKLVEPQENVAGRKHNELLSNLN